MTERINKGSSGEAKFRRDSLSKDLTPLSQLVQKGRTIIRLARFSFYMTEVVVVGIGAGITLALINWQASKNNPGGSSETFDRIVPPKPTFYTSYKDFGSLPRLSEMKDSNSTSNS